MTMKMKKCVCFKTLPHSGGPLNVTGGAVLRSLPPPPKPRGSSVDRPITAHKSSLCSAQQRDKAAFLVPPSVISVDAYRENRSLESRGGR
ncbi:hypothetical protein PAMP_012957 [Pampus punctatissimus]